MGICGGRSSGSIKGSIRILVLGISGSGKSTFAKQMKILHTEGFNEIERRSYCGILRNNIIFGVRELCDTIIDKELEVHSKNRKKVRYFRESDIFELDLCNETVLAKVKALWEDSYVQDIWKKSKNFQVQVSQMDYLMEHIDRYVSLEFTPSDEDILRCRQRTSGSHTTRLVIDRHIWELVDVGGQLPERVKWVKLIKSGIHCIIYFASLDEYNMESSEDKEKTKMEISIDVFRAICNEEDSTNICTILFLNKSDLLEEKLSSKTGVANFHEKFPNFKAYLKSGYVESLNPKDKNDLELIKKWKSFKKNEKNIKINTAALRYIEEQFRGVIVSEVKRKELVVKHTCAIDTNHINIVFSSIKEKVFLTRMNASGIVI